MIFSTILVMIPGINPKQMEKAMKQLGMKQEAIEAEEVVIRCNDKEIVIRNPDVSKINMMGKGGERFWDGGPVPGLSLAPQSKSVQVFGAKGQINLNILSVSCSEIAYWWEG